MNDEKKTYSAVSGSVDVILSVSHNTEHSGNDSKRKNSFQPMQRHLSFFLSYVSSSSSMLFDINKIDIIKSPSILSLTPHYFSI
jgi:hypothetical protein